MKKRISVIFAFLVIVMALCACQPAEKTMLSEENIKGICELASLKCYCNNVAKIEKEPDNIFQVKREMWIEYEGVVTLGINMDELQIHVSGDSVTIDMPQVRILSSEFGEIDPDSYYTSEDSWFIHNQISTEEQNEAVHKSQEEMKNKIMNDAGLIAKAEGKIKQTIEQYINQIGQLNGQEYTVVWEKSGE